MRGPLWVLAGALVVAGLVAWLALRTPVVVDRVDLINELPTAAERRPSADAFTVVEAKLGDRTVRSILVRDPSRIVYAVRVPPQALLRLSLGLAEESWTTEGDGVLFRILLASDRENQRELFHRMMTPFTTASDRSWHDVELDLAAYADRTIYLSFNTNASLPGRDDRRGDLALWGAPRIVAPDS